MNTLMLIIAFLILLGYKFYFNLVLDRKKEAKKTIGHKLAMEVLAPTFMLFIATYMIGMFATRNYLMSNPKVLIEVSDRLQAEMQEEAEKQSEGGIKELMSEAQVKDAPIEGNPEGSVVVYEFFDYYCGYCKKAAAVVEEIVKENPDVKVVLKNFPMLTQFSAIPAKAAIAAQMQGKGEELHRKLIQSELKPDLTNIKSRKDAEEAVKAIVFGLAEEVGLNVEQLKKDMESPVVDEELLRTKEIVGKLGLRGTPAFVVGKKLYKGYIDKGVFTKAIQEAR